jgi:hypothetical protein
MAVSGTASSNVWYKRDRWYSKGKSSCRAVLGRVQGGTALPSPICRYHAVTPGYRLVSQAFSLQSHLYRLYHSVLEPAESAHRVYP